MTQDTLEAMGLTVEGLQVEQQAFEVWTDLPEGRVFGFGSTHHKAVRDLVTQLPTRYLDHARPDLDLIGLPLEAARHLEA